MNAPKSPEDVSFASVRNSTFGLAFQTRILRLFKVVSTLFIDIDCAAISLCFVS